MHFSVETFAVRSLDGNTGTAFAAECGGVEAQMYLAKVYDPAARAHRVRYAIANILRDRVVNEGAFNVCFEMGDEDAVIRTILSRGLKNPRLRLALERSHLIDLTHWLARYPDLAEAYCASDHAC